MVTISTCPSFVVDLGGQIAAKVTGLDDVVADVAGAPDVGDPPQTAGALVDFLTAYKQTVKRLRDDVVALGRLTQAAGAEYDAVEAAATRVDLAQGPPTTGLPSLGGSARGSDRPPRREPPSPTGPFGPIGCVHPLHDLGVHNG